MDSMFDPIPTEGDEAPTKKVRHRKKQFLQSIRKQMEFYFSDANLSKNRFLGQIVAKDPEVDLSLFLQFNKIRDLTSDLKDIRKALKKSEMLALTEDGTKVYRNTAIRHNDQTDESTIYVERLPPDADHEWLRSVFLPYGEVPYVSIPKYPHNGLNKGFAFVEFDSPESATKALEAFGAMGCRLTAEFPPDQICSNKQGIGSLHGNDAQVAMDPNFKVPTEKNIKKKSKSKTKKLKSDVVEDSQQDQDVESKSKQPERKRKISFDDEHEAEDKSVPPVEEERKAKKMKIKQETNPDWTESSTEGAECSKKQHKIMKDGADGGPEKTLEEEDNKHDTKSSEVEIRTSKKRKLRRSEDEEVESTEQNLEEDAGKHSKKQRKEAGTVEQEADKPAVKTEPTSKDTKDDEKENEGNEEGRKRKKSRRQKKKNKKERLEPEPNMNLRVLSKSEWKRLRNKYLDLQKVRMTQLKQHLHRSRWGNSSQDHDGSRRRQEKPKTEKKFSFTPGVIIHLRFSEPLADVKKFKTDAKTNPDVKYVDAMEGWEEAYIRCSTAEAASEMVAQQPWSQMDVLTGAEETAYWEKMNRDREVKCSRNERVKVRGKAKLLAKVEKAVGKHIRFTTDEEVTPKG